ncbi:hypothetical protein GCM10011380_00420 [Sphingomonas metalli]|uniref:Uncharacterized protein n=1 Tax=Sphingomonas metalli TaxID=1779358 RepID=A0A916WNC6_9SPHN|nr:hypothetical protein [Sphingomonas metalli]GGB14928.1 hypothetical protein GCM10011380_00420 [Sphingomonas metalli]
MNAVTRIQPDESIYGSRTERAYRATIAVHVPDCDEMSMAARCDIAAMRDQASVGMARATDSAVVILGEVSRMASAAVYADMPTSNLLRVRAALKLTMMAAREVERIQRDG